MASEEKDGPYRYEDVSIIDLEREEIYVDDCGHIHIRTYAHKVATCISDQKYVLYSERTHNSTYCKKMLPFPHNPPTPTHLGLFFPLNSAPSESLNTPYCSSELFRLFRSMGCFGWDTCEGACELSLLLSTS